MASNEQPHTGHGYLKPTRPPTEQEAAKLAAMNDLELVETFTHGDHQAFAEITRRHYRKLWMLARRYTGSEHDADDVMQDTMLKVIANIDRYRGDASLGTWLQRMVRNTCYDHMQRKRSKQAESLEKLDVERNLGHDPTRVITTRLFLSHALEQLPVEQRAAIVLVDYHGLGVEAAAGVLGVRPGTVKSRRARARAALKDLLQAPAHG
ncbi:sigma-70 family RNA polymerase sigma factor [Corynebacterium sp. 35RC1]|nr:sigma-70 family RNA polymerase sigma factor [Corynebacterium sp. 35RC1]